MFLQYNYYMRVSNDFHKKMLILKKRRRKEVKCQCCGKEFTPDEFYYDFCRECSYKWEYEIP